MEVSGQLHALATLPPVLTQQEAGAGHGDKDKQIIPVPGRTEPWLSNPYLGHYIYWAILAP